MKKKRFVRKKKIVDPRYQFKFAFFIVFFLFVYSAVFGVAMFLPLALEMQSSPSLEDQGQVAQIVLGLHDKIWPAMIATLVLAFVGAILYSHRIVGPLVGLRNTVDESFLKGDFSKRVRFRKTDELKEVETIFNRLADYLERAQTADAVFHADLKHKLQLLEEKLADAGQMEPDSAKKALAVLVGELDMQPDLFTRQL